MVKSSAEELSMAGRPGENENEELMGWLYLCTVHTPVTARNVRQAHSH